MHLQKRISSEQLELEVIECHRRRPGVRAAAEVGVLERMRIKREWTV